MTVGKLTQLILECDDAEGGRVPATVPRHEVLRPDARLCVMSKTVEHI